SDRTRASWDSGQVLNLKMPDGVSSVFVDVGVKEPEDLGIERVVVDPVSAPPGSEVTIAAFIRATGNRADRKVIRKVICQVDAGRPQEEEAQVEPGNPPAAVRFTYRTAPLGAGSHQVVVRLEGTDQLPFNNTRFATFVVNPGRKVLLLADAPRTRAV